MPINNHSIVVPLPSLSASNLILPLIACTITSRDKYRPRYLYIPAEARIYTSLLPIPSIAVPATAFCDRVSRAIDTPWTHRGHTVTVGKKERKMRRHSHPIVDSNSLSRNLAGIRFLIGEQSAENSHFVPSRRVSLLRGRFDQLSFPPPNNCPFVRLSSEPTRLDSTKNEAHRCSKTSRPIVPALPLRV